MKRVNAEDVEPTRYAPGAAVAALIAAAGAWFIFEANRQEKLELPWFILTVIGVLLVVGGVHKFFDDLRRIPRNEKGKPLPVVRFRPRDDKDPDDKNDPPRDDNGFIDHKSEGSGW